MAAHPQRLLQHVRMLVPGSSPGPESDAELLASFTRACDEDAFAALVGRHGPMVLGVCRRLLRDHTAAEDVAQAAFLMLARKARSIRRPETLAVWLHQTARHLALKYRRADARRRTSETRSVQALPIHTIPTPVDELTVRELLAIFDEELQRLPDRYRLPLILCCLESCTQDEAARRLGWTPGSVKGRLERARQRLHERLLRRGLSLSAALVSLEALRGRALAAEFVAETTRAALLFASGAGAIEGGVARDVVALAEESMRSAVLSRERVLLSLLLMVGVVVAGVAGVGYKAPAAKAPGEKTALVPRQPPEKQRTRPDRHGDPLPEGAVARLGTVRWRAGGEINELTFAPDGKTLVAGSRAGLFRFDLEGRPIQHICPDNTQFERIAVSPDGKRLLCRCYVWKSGERMQLQIWDLMSRRMTRQIKLEQQPHWLGWTADNEPVAIFADKKSVFFRDLATGKERQFEVGDIHFLSTTLNRCAYAPSARLLAVPDQRGVIHVWDVSTGKKRCVLETKGTRSYSVALSPDGRWLATLTYATVRKSSVQLWDVTAGKLMHTLAADQQTLGSVAFSPDGKTLATVARGSLRFHDVATGRERSRTKVVASFAQSVAFSPDSKTLATVEEHSGTIHLWDVASAAQKPTPVCHTKTPTRIAFSPDGRRVVSSSKSDDGMIVWDATTGEALLAAMRDKWLSGCQFSADGKTLFSYPNSEKLVFSDAATGRVVHTVSLADRDRPDTYEMGLDMRLSDDRQRLVALSRCVPKMPGKVVEQTMQVAGWDVATRKPLFRRRRAEVIWHAVSPDLKMLALLPMGETRGLGLGGIEPGGPVRIEALATGEHLLSLPDIERRNRPQAFSPDGRFLATSTVGLETEGKASARGGWADGSMVRLWELASVREVLALPARDTLNPEIAFSPDGRLLALTGSAKEIVLWDLRHGRERHRFTGFDAEVRCLTFSPDGQHLVSGLANSTLLVWKVASERKADRPAALDAAGAARAWADLAGEPRKAFAARRALALSPKTALPLLKERLKPVQPADAARLRHLFTELDGDTFEAREKARKELEQLGDRAGGALQEVLKSKPSLETHRRIEALLKRLRPPITDAETLRSLRAIAVLEDIGTPEARQILATLAKGAVAVRRTVEAKAALGRLAR